MECHKSRSRGCSPAPRFIIRKTFRFGYYKKRRSRNNSGSQGFGLESAFKSDYFFVTYQFLILMFNLMFELLFVRTVFWKNPLKISKTIKN